MTDPVTAEHPTAKSKIGIIAGSGPLPLQLAESCRANGRPFFVIAIDGETDPAVERFPHIWSPLGSFGLVIKTLKAEGCKEVVLLGPVKRPDLKRLKLDWRAAKLLPKFLKAAKQGGDDALFKVIIGDIEREGLKVIGAEDVLDVLLADEGPLGKVKPAEEDWADIAKATQVVHVIGEMDIGQGAIVCDGCVLCVEAAEGTDNMLERCAHLPEALRGTEKARRGVLVKLAKPGQDRRVDLPTIGVRTVENAAKAGLAGIAVEAEGALVYDKADVARKADAHGLFVVGIHSREILERA